MPFAEAFPVTSAATGVRSVEGSLGTDSSGLERPNDNPCPFECECGFTSDCVFPDTCVGCLCVYVPFCGSGICDPGEECEATFDCGLCPPGEAPACIDCACSCVPL